MYRYRRFTALLPPGRSGNSEGRKRPHLSLPLTLNAENSRPSEEAAGQQKAEKNKKPRKHLLPGSLVRETGIEPVWKIHTPLKRARLPVPPLSRTYLLYTEAMRLSRDFLKECHRICRHFRFFSGNMASRRSRRTENARKDVCETSEEAAKRRFTLVFALKREDFVTVRLPVPHLFLEKPRHSRSRRKGILGQGFCSFRQISGGYGISFTLSLDFISAICYNTTCCDADAVFLCGSQNTTCRCDGIGRRAGLKIRW